MNHEVNGKEILENMENAVSDLKVELDLLIMAIEEVNNKWTLSDGSSPKLTILYELSQLQQKALKEKF